MVKPLEFICFLLALHRMVSISHQTRIQRRYDMPMQRNPSYYYWRQPMSIPQPLTLSLCRNPRYNRLRTCKMAMKTQMRVYSDRYFCTSKDRWYESRRSRATGRRTKRATNQCSGTKTKNVILQAHEANRPTVLRELLHDPANHLYQTLFVENCQTGGPINGFYCRMHQIRFKAAVWSLNPTSNAIEVLDLVTDAYCALSQL